MVSRMPFFEDAEQNIFKPICHLDLEETCHLPRFQYS
jgi:hypothetical protein